MTDGAAVLASSLAQTHATGDLIAMVPRCEARQERPQQPSRKTVMQETMLPVLASIGTA